MRSRVALAALALFLVAPAWGQAGALDPSFDGDGRVVQEVGVSLTSRNSPTAVVVQADGRVLVAGSAWGGVISRFVIARFDAAGALDPSFGSGGKATAVFPDAATARDLAVGPDGSLVIAGYTEVDGVYCFAVARFSANGVLDPTFGDGGRVTTAFTAGAQGSAVVVQPDGRVVAGGYGWAGTTNGFALARYLPDGTLDPDFGDGGRVTVDLGPNSDAVHDLVLQPDGRIVAVGTAWAGTDYAFALARYLPDGAPDSTFGMEGHVITALTARSGDARAVALQPDGRIVVGGVFIPGPTAARRHTVARYLPDGTLDPSFSDDGVATVVYSGGSAEGNDLALQPDGRVLIAGWAASTGPNGSAVDFTAGRLLPDGTPDPSFGTGGVIRPLEGGAQGVAVGPDGRIVLVGPTGHPLSTYVEFTALRLLPNGALDPTFGGDGVASTLGFPPGYIQAWALALQADGAAVVAGCALVEAGLGFLLARLRPDGALDATFGAGGFVTTTFGGEACAHGVAVLPDGRLLAAGEQELPYGAILARYLPDGTPDPTFGSGGRVTLFDEAGASTAHAYALMVQPDGKAVFGGCRGGQFVLVRLLASGAPDPSFGVGGTATPGLSWCARAIALQPDGRIVATGYRQNTETSVYTSYLVRVLPDGARDPSFGANGLATVAAGGDARMVGVAVQPAGGVVAAGWARTPAGTGPVRSALYRHRPDGAADPAFGTGGVALPPFVEESDARAVLALPDERILAAGGVGYPDAFALARLLPDGAPDASFGDGGIVATDFGPGSSAVRALAVLPDGRTMVAGTATSDEAVNLALARYLGDGGVPTEPPTPPLAASLAVTPNPARASARIALTLPAPALVRLAACDVLGREVALLHDGPLGSGTHTLALNASALTPGLYVVRATGEAWSARARLVVTR